MHMLMQMRGVLHQSLCGPLRCPCACQDPGVFCREYKGIEFVVQNCQPPHLYVMSKQHRSSPDKVQTKAYYYILDGSIYQAPTLHAVFSARLVSQPYVASTMPKVLLHDCCIPSVFALMPESVQLKAGEAVSIPSNSTKGALPSSTQARMAWLCVCDTCACHFICNLQSQRYSGTKAAI